MTVSRAPVAQSPPHGMPFVVAVMSATALLLAGLLRAGQAGLLPKAPTQVGADPADRYLSSQTLGERAAEG